jgi:type VI secretion system protein ImpK
MIPDDPFATAAEDNKTIMRPIPGGRGKRAEPPPHAFSADAIFSASTPKLGNLNPLEKAASGLLTLITKLNSSQFHSDPMGLKNRIIQEIEQFQNEAQKQQIDLQTIANSRYVLCTALDEAIINTPWGHNSGWTQNSLLAIFHNEVDGGKRFFDLLKSLGQNPAQNRYLLELMYLCLALGFEGHYRLIEGGKNKLASIREWLYQLLQKERGAIEPLLSPHWQGITDRRAPLLKVVPLWVFVAVAATLLAAIFTVFLFSLNQASDPVFQSLLSIKAPTTEIVAEEPIIPTIKSQLTLSILLADDIGLKHVSVKELTQRSTVTIQSDNLFSPGSSSVNPVINDVLQRIAEALNRLPGQVLITGHSDNTPIRSIRYPSNWHLSKARAQAVADVLKPMLSSPERLTIVGKSDLEPVASNKTPEGRAKNRRVEITLLK